MARTADGQAARFCLERWGDGGTVDVDPRQGFLAAASNTRWREHPARRRASVDVMTSPDPRASADSRPAADRGRVADWFDEHAAGLAAYAARRVGADLARDIVADTFRVALEQYERFDPRHGEARAWLFGIATNLIRRHWRTEERCLRTQARALDGRGTPLDPLLRTVEQLDAGRRYQQVVSAVALLPADDRDLLVLVAWEQMTSRQAAAVLGIPPGTVRSRLSRIRAELARHTHEGEIHG